MSYFILSAQSHPLLLAGAIAFTIAVILWIVVWRHSNRPPSATDKARAANAIATRTTANESNRIIMMNLNDERA